MGGLPYRVLKPRAPVSISPKQESWDSREDTGLATGCILALHRVSWVPPAKTPWLQKNPSKTASIEQVEGDESL